MAVRFDADGEDLTLANKAFGTQTTLTMCAWINQAASRGAVYSGYLEWSNGTTNNWTIESDGTNRNIILWTNSGDTEASPITTNLNTWYFVAATMNGTSHKLYVRAATDTAWTTRTLTGPSSRSCDDFIIGETAFGAEWLNGSVCAVKTWFAELTQAELEAEMWQVMPARTAGLKAWYPLAVKETTDYSGNGNTLTGGAAATTTDGPPIAWRSNRILHQTPSGGLPVSANAGTVAATATAYGASVAVGPSAANTAATTTAYGATVAVGPSAGVALSSNVIESELFPLQVAAGHASVTATAYEPAATGWAAVTATAYDATVRIMQVDVASATATAYGATVAVSARGSILSVSDNFNRANNETLGDVSSGGYTWTEQGGTVLAIATNKLARPTGGASQGGAYIDVGASDIDASIKLATIGTSTHRGGVLFRGVDDNNYWRFTRDSTGTRLWRTDAGVTSTISFQTATLANVGDTLRVVTSGSSIRCYVNSTEVHTVTDATYSTATRVGVFIIETSVELDDFSLNWSAPIGVSATAPAAASAVSPAAGAVAASVAAHDSADPAGYALVTATAFRATVTQNEVPPFRTVLIKAEDRASYIF